MDTAFATLGLSESLVQVCAELGFTRLTEIQARAVPELLAGKDVIGQSRTGSGKTVAFGLPMLQQLPVTYERTLQALVLCPTRELCAQVARELRRLGRKHAGLQILTLAGGEPMRAQVQALERGVQIVVGTPGRVLDHLQRGSLQLQTLATVVLDEADRMLEMGFQEAMEQILQHTPEARQTVFFSATFPRSIVAMSARYQREPVEITVTEETSEPLTIQHRYRVAEQPDKLAALLELLQQHKPSSALVFANLKVTVADVEKALARAGISAGGLHGDLEQPERDLALAKFRNGSTRVLVATDVAARGIDVAALDLVVNYDLPTRFDTYVHRTGRTGRAGQSGLAISLVTKREQGRVAALEEALSLVIEPERASVVQPTAAEHEHGAVMTTLRISGGRKQKVRPADILGALTGEAAGLAGGDIGKIEIHDHFSYVAVAKGVSRRAYQGLSEGRIKGRRFQVALLP